MNLEEQRYMTGTRLARAEHVHDLHRSSNVRTGASKYFKCVKYFKVSRRCNVGCDCMVLFCVSVKVKKTQSYTWVHALIAGATIA